MKAELEIIDLSVDDLENVVGGDASQMLRDDTISIWGGNCKGDCSITIAPFDANNSIMGNRGYDTIILDGSKGLGGKI